MLQRTSLFITLMLLCSLCCCISFNTGASLDSLGKAVPTTTTYNGPCYRLNGVAYKEVMVEYRQPNPHLIGTAFMGYFDNSGPSLPSADETGAPQPELYLARLNPDRTDAPGFIRAIDFPYGQAERLNQGSSLPES